jgi:AraC family transcriptional regulator of adaptative response / DNA-3-methyladenine glycosylase II
MDLDHAVCWRAVLTRDSRFDGRFFTAVHTTGIYCRPICPARPPKPEHVTFYPTAAAAQEVGFRPCLRCRPETSPDLAAWHGTSNTVTRALALIETGAMDPINAASDVESLAGRLGVGARQLRRLFQQHLGASPIAVAQTRRVLLAKQLIHETTLPMTQVALAAGFGSVRRFNETFQTLFDRPPAALRRGKTTTGRDAITLKLAYKPPYDWQGIIGFLSARAIPGIETVTPTCYSRVLRAGELTVEPGKGDFLCATLRLSDLTQLPAAVSRTRRLFDLSADPVAIGNNLSEDPTLAPLVARRPGLRVPGAWDGFELAIRAILGQQITVGAATALAGKLVAAYGIPDPAVIAKLDPGDLARTLGMPKSRGAALCSLAAAVLKDPSLFNPAGNLEEAVTKLRALPGIGEWTAHYIAMRELREPDAFPHTDIGLLRALADSTGARPTPAQLLARAERWRPWRAYAALHLWHSDTIPKPKTAHAA